MLRYYLVSVVFHQLPEVYGRGEVERAVVDGGGGELGGGVRRVQQVPEQVLVPVVAQRRVGRAPGLPVEPARPAARVRHVLEPCTSARQFQISRQTRAPGGHDDPLKPEPHRSVSCSGAKRTYVPSL